LLRRASQGENVFVAHRSHLYQRLVRAGRSHASVATLYGVLAVLFAASAILFHGARVIPGTAAAIAACAAFAGLILHVTRMERRALVTSASVSK
jgi:hypothetical protein